MSTNLDIFVCPSVNYLTRSTEESYGISLYYVHLVNLYEQASFSAITRNYKKVNS